MIHYLKTVQPYFDKVWHCIKEFEVRKNDRDFQAGDKVVLKEYDPTAPHNYSGRYIEATIKYVLTNPEFVKEGYCIFGIEINNCVG